MSTLYLMSGVPGSGKSTWAAKQNKLYKEIHIKSKIISSDEIRDKVYHHKFKTFDKDKEKRIWEIIYQKLLKYSSYDVVILDATNLTNKRRMFWYNKLNNVYDNFGLILINTPLEKCIAQDKMRKRHVPEAAIRESFEHFQQPNEEVLSKFIITKVV